jgi:uncharacterized SAM-binding protein YcdF (DUF218 family)
MFFILSKVLIYILMPIIWIIAILLYALFTKNQKIRKKSIIICLLMLLFFGNGIIANEAMILWEKAPVPIASLATYDTAIVLTGIADQRKTNDRVYFSQGADRVLHTVQLYKAGKVKKILITGGSGQLIGEKLPEADLLKSVFLYCGVNGTDIIIENKSRNTRESALLTRKLVDRLGIKGNFLLVTSAFHMRRAQGCFTKAGIKTDIFPVDYYSWKWKPLSPLDIIPSEGPLSAWSILLHEITGYVVYKLMGYS